MKQLNQKGIFGFDTFAEGIVTTAVVVGLGIIILVTLKSSSTSTDANTTIDNFVTKLGDFPTWIGLLIVGVAGATVLAVLKRKNA